MLWAAASVNVFYQQLPQGEAMLRLAAQLRQGSGMPTAAAAAAKLIFSSSKTTKLTDLYTILGLDFNPI